MLKEGTVLKNLSLVMRLVTSQHLKLEESAMQCYLAAEQLCCHKIKFRAKASECWSCEKYRVAINANLPIDFLIN